jgi:N-succinyldiaminopimelate aminotransferase
VPGMRSGFVAGDAKVLEKFLLYRTYHGSAMSTVVQHASRAAWDDEAHVVENRRLYREKFQRVTPLVAGVLPVALPDAGFYLWADVAPLMSHLRVRPEPAPVDDPARAHADVAYARSLLAQYNVTVLPGSLLAREAAGGNPGVGRVRLALVADTAECVEAAERIVQHAATLR